MLLVQSYSMLSADAVCGNELYTRISKVGPVIIIGPDESMYFPLGILLFTNDAELM